MSDNGVAVTITILAVFVAAWIAIRYGRGA